MGAGFMMNFRAAFDQAQVEFGFAPGGGLVVQAVGQRERQTLAVPGISAYRQEMAYFLDCVREGVPPARCLPESTLLAVQMVELERRAVVSGRRLRPASAPAGRSE